MIKTLLTKSAITVRYDSLAISSCFITSLLHNCWCLRGFLYAFHLNIMDSFNVFIANISQFSWILLKYSQQWVFFILSPLEVWWSSQKWALNTDHRQIASCGAWQWAASLPDATVSEAMDHKNSSIHTLKKKDCFILFLFLFLYWIHV